MEYQRQFDELIGHSLEHRPRRNKCIRRQTNSRKENSGRNKEVKDEDFTWESRTQSDVNTARSDRGTESADTASEISSKAQRNTESNAGASSSSGRLSASASARQKPARPPISNYDPMGKYFSEKKQYVKTTFAEQKLKSGEWQPRSAEQFVRLKQLRGIDMSEMTEEDQHQAWLKYKREYQRDGKKDDTKK